MIRAERNEDGIIESEIIGTGEQCLAEFSSLCGNFANSMINSPAELTQEEALKALSMAMAKGVANRNNHKLVE